MLQTTSKHRRQSVNCVQIGLYDAQSEQPSIKYVHMSGSSSGPTTPVDLEEAVPLHHLLAPVGLCKECIATAVDSLEPYAAVGTAAGEADSDLGSRSFGAALQAILRSANCIYLLVASSPLALPLYHKRDNSASTPVWHQCPSSSLCALYMGPAKACHAVLSGAGL